MLDMIHPTVPGKVSLNDLKRCQMTPIFFDTFFNLEKYLDHEQRDPFASQRDPDSENGDEILKVISFMPNIGSLMRFVYLCIDIRLGSLRSRGIRIAGG